MHGQATACQVCAQLALAQLLDQSICMHAAWPCEQPMSVHAQLVRQQPSLDLGVNVVQAISPMRA